MSEMSSTPTSVFRVRIFDILDNMRWYDEEEFIENAESAAEEKLITFP